MTSRRIVEYKTLYGPIGGESFTDGINQYIQDGWQPLGGVSVVDVSPHSGIILEKLLQAMVKYEEEPEERKGLNTIL